MVDSMKKVAKLDVELTVEERNLLSVGYNNVIGVRRAARSILSSIEKKEEANRSEQNVRRIKEYRQNVEAEPSRICHGSRGVLRLLLQNGMAYHVYIERAKLYSSIAQLRDCLENLGSSLLWSRERLLSC